MKLVSPEMTSAQVVADRFARDVDTPIQAMLEISDRCNEVCVHCYQEQRTKGEMDTAEVLALLDQLADQGVLFLTISGGEPTLRKDFVEIVSHAATRGFVMRIFTNGLTMTRELAEALRRCAVEAVEISVYSHLAEVHDFVTGVPNSFDRTIAGIRHLVSAGVMVVMKAPVMSVNETGVDEYIRMAEELGVHYALSPGRLHPREGGDRAHQAFDRSDEAHAALVARLEPGPQAARTGPRPRPAEARPCGAGRSIHVEPNGELRPCTLLEVGLGNVRDGTVAQHRADNGTLADMRALRWRDLHGCRDCDLAGYCNHCYAHALAETGDALGPYPGACRTALTHYLAKNGQTHPGAVAEALGPFRIAADGTCAQIADRVTEDDRALAERIAWARRAGGASPAAAVAARPGELIQLRRPGGKRAIKRRVPPGVEARGGR